MNLLRSIYKFVSPRYMKLYLEYKVVLKPRYGYGRMCHPELYDICNKNREDFKNRLFSFLQYKNIYQEIKIYNKFDSDFEPKWNNGFLPGLDIIALYGLINHYKPKRYIEIGSGFSTMVAKKSIKENSLNTQIVSIDPFPRAFIDTIADVIIREPLENMSNYDIISNLDRNDILFIDNSHRCLPNSDVVVCFLELLPRLKKGVVIHIHDVYIPYDYPQFMCDRFYSEQYLLATVLLNSCEKFNIVLPNAFISEDEELRSILNPVWNHPGLSNVEKHGGSFWFQKV